MAEQNEDWENPFQLGVTPQQNIKVFSHDNRYRDAVLDEIHHLALAASTPDSQVSKIERELKQDSRVDFISDTQGFIDGYEVVDDNSEAFNPRSMLLQDAGHKMLLLTPHKRNVVVNYDVETGTKMGDFSIATHADAYAMRVESLTPSIKWSNTEQQQVFDLMAVGGNEMARLQWDQRTPVKDNLLLPVDDAGRKTYSRANFTASIAAVNGGLAVGDAKGSVRLFKDPTEFKLMDAKTKYDQYALDKPVVGMDVTGDGKYVMWTTQDTIHIVDCTWEDGNKTKTGFWDRGGKNKKPILRIQLSPDELASMGLRAQDVNFTAARFDNNARLGRGTEQVIASSTGPFVVHWSVAQVLADYKRALYQPTDANRSRRAQVNRREGSVLTECFEFGDKSSVLVGALSDRLERFSLGGDGTMHDAGSSLRGTPKAQSQQRCGATTRAGAQCSRYAVDGGSFCYQHE